jgi:hypothetical protein
MKNINLQKINNMKIKHCRSCGSRFLKSLFSLGSLSFTGKFPKNKKKNIPKTEIKLDICKNCNLVQINKKFDLKYMYNQDYGYRTGINSTMTLHIRNVVDELSKRIKFKRKDIVLDIASNDATLLNFYNKKLVRIGVDPLVKKYKNYYKEINYYYSNFFKKNLLPAHIIKKKIKAITAFSVFYDLENPNLFLKDISEIIDPKYGIFILEHTDLLSIIKNNLFDTICHEHLAYYSAEVLSKMINKNNLRIFDIKKNNINGGSLRFYICHKEANYKENKSKIDDILIDERLYNLAKKETFKDFFNRINKLKKKLLSLIIKLKNDGKIIHGYGASTKGNVLLQYYKINSGVIPFIADRNFLKVGSYTPGSKIKIISEESSRAKKPDYYLVLPWHFKDEILLREKKIRSRGCKFIFPLPKILVI